MKNLLNSFIIIFKFLIFQEESKQEAIDALYNDIINKQCLMNNEYTTNNVSYVSLVYPDSQTDVANGLVADGLVLVEPRREKRLSKLMSTYNKSQDKAKSERVRQCKQ